MREPNLTILAAMSSLISTPVIVVAIVVIAIIMGIGGLFILRSGKKNPIKPPISASGTSDWQRQGQPGAAGAWNQQPGQQQGSAAGWNQQPGQQPANSWNAPDASGQQNSWAGQQQAGANPWGGVPTQQPAWGAPAPNAQPQWGQNPGQPEQPQWGQNPAQPAANNSWSGVNQQPQQQAWGNQNAGAPSWDAAAPAAPAPQDPWSQPQSQPLQQSGSGQQWGAIPGQPQPPTAYGNPANPSNPAWSQPQSQDPWGATPRPQGSGNFGNPAPAPAPQTAPWQQPQQPAQDSYGQYGGNVADNDKTMLRSPGSQAGGGIGYVRVDEGKEPGRIYEIRKESLSMGRSRESDIFLEDLAVSRLHASLVNMGNGSYALKDEGSANGTKVNGQLVNKFQTYPLQEGDRVQLGQTVLVFAKK